MPILERVTSNPDQLWITFSDKEWITVQASLFEICNTLRKPERLEWDLEHRPQNVPEMRSLLEKWEHPESATLTDCRQMALYICKRPIYFQPLFVDYIIDSLEFTRLLYGKRLPHTRSITKALESFRAAS